MNDGDASPAHLEQEAADSIDNAIPTRGYQMLPMVGLGGSAGAIPALQSFFQSLPPDPGMAFVVILHLSETQESALAQVLQRCTPLRVIQVLATERVEVNTVYVIPPGRSLKTVNGYLRLAESASPRGRHLAVDLFFRSLADTYGPRSTAIVLSGADRDGTIGIKRIKERGGLTIVQDPGEAEHPSMPRSAIGTGVVDWVLPVSQMAALLLDYQRLGRDLKLPPEEGPRAGVALIPDAGFPDESLLRDVLNLLRMRTGRDFSCYKRATILRRIGRRMQVNGVTDLGSYLGCLRTRPGEAGALLDDLLISVTNFFRDSDNFRALEECIPQLFADKGPADSVRVWVSACATGEEAYSIAMLLQEHARTLDAPPSIQVFATDLSEEAIQAAREGFYPSTIEADLSEVRLERFFHKERDGYRVSREVREIVLFAVHDLLKDSPFSRLDLASCRNLLIYLEREAQARAIDIFHYALRPGGYLFLGSSEGIEEGSALFAIADKKSRLYVQRPARRTGVPVPKWSRSHVEPGLRSAGARLPAHAGAVIDTPQPEEPEQSGGLDTRGSPWGDVHLHLLERLAPSSVLVDTDYDILHLSPSAHRFLPCADGALSLNLLNAVHPDLRAELRAALYEAVHSAQPVVVPNVPLAVEGEDRQVTLQVHQAKDVGLNVLLVTFEAGTPGEASLGSGVAAIRLQADPATSHLGREVVRLKAHLRDTVEQHEASTEELKASNEELQAMNEELRSAGEELETGREELQSINEELITVNHELKARVEDLAHANSDMQNLMNATDIATLFLDRELRIMRYTPPAVHLFNLIPTDLGRPLAHLTTRLNYIELGGDAARVLERLVPIEREVDDGHGTWYLARLLPYRTLEDRIAGVVLTLVDISERKHSQEALRRSEERFRAIVDQASVGVIQGDLEGRVVFVNACQSRLLGYPEAELLGMRFQDFMPPFGKEFSDGTLFETVLRERKPHQEERRCLRKDGSLIWVHNSVTFLCDARGEPNATLMVSLDITERKRAEEALRGSEEHLRLVIENAREYAIFSTDVQGHVTAWNSGAERLLGHTGQEMLGRQVDDIFTPEDRQAGLPAKEMRTALRDGRVGSECFHVRKDGKRFWSSGALMSMQDAAGHMLGFVRILRDRSEAQQAEQALQGSQAELVAALETNEKVRHALEAANSAKDRFLAVLSHELRTPLTPVFMAVQLLSRRDDLPSAVQDALALIHRNVRVQSRLIDDLLDLTHISRGTLEIQRNPMDLHKAVQEAVEVCQADLQAREQTLTLHLNAQRHAARGDATRFQQVVWNLLKNASKFTPAGGTISVTSTQAGQRFFLDVHDSGVGIAPEVLPRIFHAFEQGGAEVTREFGGLGLGLAISRATVEAHGGILRARSPGLGQGATFSIEIPLDEGAP